MEILNQYLEKILAWLESGTMFLEEQVPLYVQELLQWRMWNFIIWDSVLLLFCVGFVIMFTKGIKRVKEYIGYSGEELGFTLVAIGALGSVGTFFGFVATTCRVIQIIVAPRVYLIEYLTSKLAGN